MGFLQDSFLTNIFIMIEQDSKFCFVHVYRTVDGKVKKKEKEKFFYEKNNKTPSVMINYIYSFSKKYSCTYISVVLDSNFQQVSLEQNIDRKFAKSLEEDNESILIHKDWRIYSSMQDINEIKNDFRIFTLDFIFSPYAILYYLYTEAKKGDNSLYILVLSSNITMAIFKDSICVSHINISKLSDSLSEDGDYDIEDLDELEDSFDMQSDEDDSDLELDLSYDESSLEENGGNTEDAGTTSEAMGGLEQNIIENIQKTINSFYESVYYKQDEDLIDNIMIFDQGTVNSKMRAQIKEETMFDIFSKNIQFSDTMYSIIKNTLQSRN